MATPSENLRVVGQEFEKNEVSDFEVFFEADGCRVRGTLPPRAPEPAPQPSRRWSLKGLLGSSASAVQTPPEETAQQSEVWERRFTWSDLDALREQYRAQRSGARRTPDDYATSQVLRVVGAYVERQHWELEGVTRARHLIEIRYRRPDGRVEAVSQPFSEFYDFSVRLSKQRQEPSAG